MKQLFICLSLSFIFLFLHVPFVDAKVLPQSRTQKSGGRVLVGPSISISPRLRADRSALLVSFGNLQNASSVSYILTYSQNGQQEGAGGSTDPSQGNTASRELLFGTCSSGVCRLHSGISNMRFEVTTQLKSGKSVIKRFRIRV